MKKIIIVVLICFSFITNIMSDGEKKTKYGIEKSLITGINLNQASFQNWTKGGDNNFSWVGKINGKFEKKDSSYIFNSNLKMSFGQIKINGQNFRKSIDEIKIETVFIKNMGIKVNPYLSVNIETQLAPGFVYSENGDRIASKFFDPGYITQGLGFGTQPDKHIAIRLGAAFKETFTSKYPSPYADNLKTKKIEKIKIEPGSQLAAEINWGISKNAIFNSKLQSFSNLKSIKEVDVKVDNSITTKISKYFNINIEYDLMYDYDQSKQIQVKQSFSFGIQYAFI